MKIERDVRAFGKIQRLGRDEIAFDEPGAKASRFPRGADCRKQRSIRGKLRLMSARTGTSFGPRAAPLELGDACLIERHVRKTVRVAIQFAPHVFDGEIIKLAREFGGALVERLEVRAFHFVAALHLADEEFGIAADAQRTDAVARGVIERGEKREILSDVVRFTADILGQLEDDFSGGIAENHCVGCGAGIAARRAINIRDVNASRRRRRMRRRMRVRE